MSSLFLRSYSYVVILFFILFFICCFFLPLLDSSENSPSISIPNKESLLLSSSNFTWPIPGYTRVSSPFGPRKAPTAGASSFHKGIDVPAPTGTNLVAISSGKVISAGFAGSGGFTVTYLSPPYRISYCHVSPEILVSPGQIIYSGQVIATVGPKNVYGVIGNPYKDKDGNPTNGSLTGPHLHLSIKKDDVAIDPFSLFQ